MRPELIEGKLSRSVPRGLGGSNPTWLLDGRLGNHRLYPAADALQRPLCSRFMNVAEQQIAAFLPPHRSFGWPLRAAEAIGQHLNGF